MATFISVPLKKSSEVDLVKPLSKFVTMNYPAGEEQTEYIRALEELNKLRKNALGRPLDKHDSSLEILLRYFDQLSAVEPKFPFSENQLCLTFTWKDAFDRGSLFGGSVKLALASLGYEKTCVLFNAAALASQIASEQNLDSDEGLRAAAKYYQLASGALLHIKDTVLSALNREPTMDISPETVGALHHIMLAQAQEVFFLKATSDKMKDAIIAKLANQAADFYGDAFKQCQYKENLPKEVLPVLAAKHCIMQANAELHQSILAKQNKHFGEEIARLQHAAELVKTVASRYDEYVSVKDLSDKINRALANAKKDNDFIYHDRVPEVKDLANIGKAALAKATAISPPLSQKFTDLFEKMVPMAVQQAMGVYNQRKAETVNRLVGTMREATNLCNGVLASLNLPAALEDLSGDTIPQSIAEKSRAVVSKGGLQSIEQLIRDLPDLMTRNREILDESLKMLDDEETTDNELRSKFNQRWNRTPSGDLYKPLRTEGASFRSKLDVATHADGVVRERFNTNGDMITLLCKSEGELNAAIPSANPAKTLQGSEVVNVLRSLLTQLDEVKREREGLEGEIKAATFDMTANFLAAMEQDRSINEEALSLSQLDQQYGQYNQKVQATLRTQEELLGNVQTAHQEFSGLKQSNSEANSREEVLKKLASAHDSYVEITNNLSEGTKFYNGLTEILLKFQNKCSDIIFARKTERDELLKELQQSIAREPSAPSFNAPAYQSNLAASAAAPGPGAPANPTPAPRTVFVSGQQAQQQTPQQPQPTQAKVQQPPARPPPPSFTPQGPTFNTGPMPPTAVAPQGGNPPPMAPPGQAQGPPYPSYQGYPGYYQMPMNYNPNPYPMGYSMPYMPYQAQPGQPGYPGAPPAGQPYPGYPQQPPQQQPYYPQQ